MPLFLPPKHSSSSVAVYTKRRGFLHSLKKEKCKPFQDRPEERHASSVSLLLLDDPTPRPDRRALGIGSISEIQLSAGTWNESSGNSSPSSSPTTRPRMNATASNSLSSPLALDTKALLSLSDSIRSSLAYRSHRQPNGTLIDPQDADYLDTFLSYALSSSTSVSFQTVKDAHLDKLLSDLIRMCPSRLVRGVQTNMRRVLLRARKLERVWRERFRDRFFTIDEMRSLELEERWPVDGDAVLKAPNIVPLHTPCKMGKIRSSLIDVGKEERWFEVGW